MQLPLCRLLVHRVARNQLPPIVEWWSPSREYAVSEEGYHGHLRQGDEQYLPA